MKYKEALRTKEEIEQMGHGIENNIISDIDINIIGHFGNCVSLEIACDGVYPISGYVGLIALILIIINYVKICKKERGQW